MPDITLRLHPFADMDHATSVADDIRNAGEIQFVDANGATVNVNVGDVTVTDSGAEQ
ncbi:MAG TPA: hypothetical protein VNS88_03435 [Nitrospiraceae bacterium]|nr:hypothetical protein [Nitrospiraceae bacterium]